MTTAVVETATPAPVAETVTPPEGAPAVAPAAVEPTVEAAVTPPTEAPQIGDGGAEDDGIEAPTSADAVDGVITYAPTGDPGMDMALEFAGTRGLGMDHPAMLATLTGDWSLLEAHFASMGDKATGYERYIALAKAADEKFAGQAQERADKLNKAVSSVLGETQADVLKWAGENADPDEKRDINLMLKASPLQAKAAAMMLADLYSRATGTTVTPANAMGEGSGAVPNSTANAPLSNRQFAVECAKLVNQYGPDNYQRTTEYAALTRRLGK